MYSLEVLLCVNISIYCEIDYRLLFNSYEFLLNYSVSEAIKWMNEWSNWLNEYKLFIDVAVVL